MRSETTEGEKEQHGAVSQDKTISQRKKKRTLGNFPCPECPKIFSRSDHLSRHYLNHRPKEVFYCDFVINEFGNKRKCGKTFVRKDLKERHIKRHYEVDETSIGNRSKKKSTTESAVCSDGLIHPFTGIGRPSKQMKEKTSAADFESKNQRDLVKPMTPTGKVGVDSPLSSVTTTMMPEFPELQIPLDDSSARYQMPQNSNDILSWFFFDNGNFTPNMFSKDESTAHIAKQTTQAVNSSHSNPVSSNLDLVIDNVIPTPTNNSDSYNIAKEHQVFDTSHHEIPEVGHVIKKGYEINEKPTREQSLKTLNEIHDSHIFSNSDNLLDDLFFKGYNDLDSKNEIDSNGTKTSSLPSSDTPSLSNEQFVSPLNDIEIPNSMGPRFNNGVAKKSSEKINKAAMKHVFVDENISNAMFESLTLDSSKVNQKFAYCEPPISIKDRLSFYLNLYWSIFHPQFPILHKPSFNTKDANPLLLASMVLVGGCYTSCSDRYSRHGKTHFPAYEFCMSLSSPLRYKVFEHEDFKSPVKLWVLQCLNMLEWSEKNFLSRHMHERAHVHHATTVQLLMRSPLFGGNPSKYFDPSYSRQYNEEELFYNPNVESNSANDSALFGDWVVSESFKRITFLTFYLDIIDYIKFRHSPVITLYQLQMLNLPCDDENIWNSDEVNGSFNKVAEAQKKLRNDILSSINTFDGNINYLRVLKNLINSKSRDVKISKTSMFSKRLLYGGLVSLMYQVQQMSLLNTSSFVINNSSHHMRHYVEYCVDILTTALDDFCFNVYANCTNLHGNKKYKILTETDNSQCKFAIYHLTQIIGMSDINHYDIAIYGGSPGNMNVSASSLDIHLVHRKLETIYRDNSENHSPNGIVNFKGIIHCYLILWELMLEQSEGHPDNQSSFIDWDFEVDFFDGVYAITVATLVLWSYTYSVCGIESTRFDPQHECTEFSYSMLLKLSAEGGYDYLYRIRQEFMTLLEEETSHEVVSLHPYNSKNYRPHEIVEKYCKLLSRITNKQNISGLCFLVGTKLLNSPWEILRENAKLVINCGLRSIGKRDPTCNVFENNYIH